MKMSIFSIIFLSKEAESEKRERGPLKERKKKKRGTRGEALLEKKRRKKRKKRASGAPKKKKNKGLTEPKEKKKSDNRTPLFLSLVAFYSFLQSADGLFIS